MLEADIKNVLRIFPGPPERRPLHGLYLRESLRPLGRQAQPFVYANFIASLDGRISLPDARTQQRIVPPAIANRRDWRLFQELAACADALVTSGSYVRNLPRGVSARSFPVSRTREHADLLEWRLARGLAPQPAVVIVTASLELPPLDALVQSSRSVYVATGSAAGAHDIARVESQGARVLLAGDGPRVRSRQLIDALAREAHWNIAVIAGGEVLDTFMVDDALDRLYLTVACRLVGGRSFDTLLTGPVLEPARDFRLEALHYDARESEEIDVEQLFAVFGRSAPPLP